MGRSLTKAIAATAFGFAISGAVFAAPETVRIPSSLANYFEKMGIDKVASIEYQDEQGKPVDEKTFVDKLAASHSFRVAKKPVAGQDGAMAVTLRVQTREEGMGKFSRLKEGQPVPEFHLTKLDGSAADNTSLLGHYTVVSFYFAGCGPCVHEVPVLNTLAAARKDVNYLAITFDSADETREFVKQHGLSWPIVTGAKALTDAIGVRAYPTLALVGPEGKLLDVGAGERDMATLNKWLDKFTHPETR